MAIYVFKFDDSCSFNTLVMTSFDNDSNVLFLIILDYKLHKYTLFQIYYKQYAMILFYKLILSNC